MNKFLIILIICMGLLKADEGMLKLAMDLTTSNIDKFERSILKGITFNKAYYQGQFKELEVVVIIHGGAYKFFIKDLSSTKYKKDKKLLNVSKELGIRIKSLHDTYGVRFLICEAGMNYHSLRKENIYNFVELTPNAMIALIDAQNDGFAYIPVR